MFKKSVMLVLITVGVILALFSTSSRLHAMSGPDNLALNPSRVGFPQVTASYTCSCDNVWDAVNGTFYYKGNQPRDRWTDYGGHTTDWLAIDFGSAKSFNEVKLYIYNDGGGVQPPASYSIQYWNGSAWVNTTNQTKTPTTPKASLYSEATPENTLNTVDFDTVTSQKLQVVFTNKTSSGLVELEVFNQSLINTISSANVIYNVAFEGTHVGQYSSGAKATLAAAIGVAQGVANDADVNQIALDAAKTNLNIAISSFELSVVTLESYYSAFSNEAGKIITLNVSNILNTSYTTNASNFKVYNGSSLYSTVSSVSQNGLDNTISLTLETPLPANIASFHVNLLENAFKTNQGFLSSSANNIPITQASQLDLNGDHRIGIDDLVLLQSSNSTLKDINHDGIFDKNDLQILLKQIMPVFVSPSTASIIPLN